MLLKKRSTHGYRLSLGLLNGSIKAVAQGERSQFGGPANVVQTSAHVKTVRFLSNTNKKKGDKKPSISQFGGPANVVQTSAHVKTVRFLSNTNKKKGDKKPSILS